MLKTLQIALKEDIFKDDWPVLGEAANKLFNLDPEHSWNCGAGGQSIVSDVTDEQYQHIIHQLQQNDQKIGEFTVVWLKFLPVVSNTVKA